MQFNIIVIMPHLKTEYQRVRVGHRGTQEEAVTLAAEWANEYAVVEVVGENGPVASFDNGVKQ